MRIAFLTPDLLGGNSQKTWKGVVAAARARGASSVCLVGGFLGDNHRHSFQANVLYDLVNEGSFHGVVIRGHLCSGMNYEEEMAFYRRFEPLPCVVIGRQAECTPHVLMDSYRGMRDAITHLIEAHGLRRIAFLRGPDLFDAEERYRAYRDVLADYGIAYDSELVTPVLHSWDSDLRVSIEQLFNHPQRRFDAIVTASDGLAQELFNELKIRNIRVPEEVAVVGFDNSGSLVMPRLTSVDAGFYEQGTRAVEMLFAQIAGEAVPQRVLLPTRLYIRQSCGCLDREVVRAAAEREFRLEPALSSGLSPQISLLSHLKGLLQSTHETWYVQLVQALIYQIEHSETDHFLRVLDSILRAAADRREDLDMWHNNLSILRAEVVGEYAAHWVEDLFQQARVLVSQMMVWAEAKKRKEAQKQTDLLYEISQTLVTTFDTTELMDMLSRELPRLDIPRAFISLYEQPDQPLNHLRLMMGYDENGRTDQSGVLYPTSRLLPEHLLPAERPYNLVVEPLYFQEQQQGLAIFETGPWEGSVYDVLRGQISSALKGAQLFLQNIQLYRDAKDAQKSAEEANRLKSRFLASVSHELRTPLNMLIGLSEALLEEPRDGRPPLPALYRQDLHRISTSAHHLDDLLRDVLDLAHSQVGRLKLVRKPADLRDVLAAVGELVEPIIIQNGLAWRLELPSTPVPVWIDVARIKQVLLNLIHNANKFTAEGEIALRVMPGNGEVTVAISDTGLGIPVEDQALIFDEFQTTQRATARGYGGMGLGLAICRRLVEMHNGRITVESPGTEGSGSTFYFTLPVMSHYPARTPAMDTPGKQSVLLVSEEHRYNLQLEEYLIREGFEIEVLQVNADVPGSLPIMMDVPPALIILDVEFGSPHRQELIQHIKAHPATYDVPILFYSLFQDSGSLFMLDHLAKPVDTGTLARALARYGIEGRHHQTTILVVDDDDGTREMNMQAVQSQLPGCNLIEASNGRTALELMRQQKPDLVLLDLMMPELDGFDVLIAMQEDERIRHIPTIILTAMSLTEEHMARISRGAATILSKGVFSVDETLAHIENVLARNRQLGSEAQRVVRKVMAYIHQHYAEPISRRDMAAYAGVSERHLDRCFRQDTSITPVDYLNRYRIRQAKILLAQGEKSLTEIALAVGFSSSSHFGRVFRREVGSSPSAYRSQ